MHRTKNMNPINIVIIEPMIGVIMIPLILKATPCLINSLISVPPNFNTINLKIEVI